MKKEWFFDCYCGQQFAALVEDGKLAEFTAEKVQNGVLVGNIYKGKVTNVLSGMNAVFVNCGLARNCYLSMDETYADYTKYDGQLNPVTPTLKNVKVGDELIVQITKPPRGAKGAKVTTNLSFVGKRIIYLPNTDFLGISRKITDEKLREELLETASKMREHGKTEGFIVRTQAPFATAKQLKAEASYLKKLHRAMLNVAKNAEIGDLIYSDDDLPTRSMRDSFGDEITAIHVGNKALYETLLKGIRLRGDVPERKLRLYEGNRSMMREHGIFELALEAAKPTVPLENGGYLVIDHTEALTVVDVNSGGCIGGANLEETVFKVNLEAAREIARQVRLRNIGGIIVVDFIDMLDEDHKEAITEELRARLLLDKAKCNVLPMSELCLTQFTRKRVGNELIEYLVKPCSYCDGNGHVTGDVFVIAGIRDELVDTFAEGNRAAIVHLNEKIAEKILDEEILLDELKTRWKSKRVYLVPHKTYREDHFVVKGDNASILSLPDNAKLLY